MAYIGRQQSSGAFLKLDDISSQFNTSTTTFSLRVGGDAFFAGNPYTLLVSLGGIIQEPVSSYSIVDDLIASGGTAKSVAKILKKEGKTITGLLSVIDLKNIPEKEKFDFPVESIITL